MKGKGEGGKLNVTQGNFVNRLCAYLHQKGLHGTAAGFVRSEIERLAASLRSIVELQGKAHSPVGRDDARTVALATYFLLGEFVLKTDMQPIDRYGEPVEGFRES